MRIQPRTRRGTAWRLLGATLALTLITSACSSDADDVSTDGTAAPDTESDDAADDSDTDDVAAEDEAASDFPDGQIELVVPWAAGGGTDQLARQMAEGAREECGWDVFVNNRDGGNGAIGKQYVADAAPDGQTIASVSVTSSQLSHTGASELTPADFAGIMQYNNDPAMLAVAADAPYDTIEEFMTAAEEGDIRLATSPFGSIWHVSAAGLASEAGVEFTYVPFQGAAPQVDGLLSGEAEGVVASPPELIGQVEAGAIKPLAVMAQDRSALLPDTPTLAEAGYDWTAGAWRGLAAPAGTPDEIVRALHDCFQQAMQSDTFQDFLETTGFGSSYRDTQEFQTYWDDQHQTWGEVFSELGLTEES